LVSWSKRLEPAALPRARLGCGCESMIDIYMFEGDIYVYVYDGISDSVGERLKRKFGGGLVFSGWKMYI